MSLSFKNWQDYLPHLNASALGSLGYGANKSAPHHLGFEIPGLPNEAAVFLLRLYQHRLAVAACLGQLTHIWFAQGNPDFVVYIWVYYIWPLVLGVSTWAVLNYAPGVETLSDALLATLPAVFVYIATALTSITIYRLFFHRIRHFPGPRWAAVWKWWGSHMALHTKRRRFKHMEALHDQYGDYVRTGPRELHIFDVAAVPVLHSVLSKCKKGPWYQAASKTHGRSLHDEVDKFVHKERRKVWDRALGAKSLRDYEPRVERHGRKLLAQFQARVGKPVSVPEWMNYYSFDVMGDVGFNKSFGMLEKGEPDNMMKSLHDSMKDIAVLGHLPWLGAMMLRTAVVAAQLRVFLTWTHNVIVERKKNTPEEKDIFSWLLDPNEPGVPMNLNADTRLMIVAGSDTTASTLTWIIHDLCANPELMKTLVDVLDTVEPEKEFLNCQDLTQTPLLDCYINETLRLHPPVPSGVERETPPEGITIPACATSGTTAPTYIPGNILTWTPISVMQTDERYFEHAKSYIPARWLPTEDPRSRADTIKDRRAFLPFSTGRYDCVGKNLAMMELRVVTANLLRRFDVRFADGEDGSRLRQNTMDCFTLVLAGMDCVFTERRSS